MLVIKQLVWFAEVDKDFLSVTKDELLQEMVFNPKDSRLATRICCSWNILLRYDGTSGQKFNFAANPYTFDIIL